MQRSNPAPIFACLYPGLCNVARELGYALAVHGSLITDFDLIAIPWTNEAIPALELKNKLLEHVGACGYEDLLRRDKVPEDIVAQIMAQKEYRQIDEGEIKPHGRIAWNLYMGAGVKIDLSVMPLMYTDGLSERDIIL